jgi:dsDNA-binding SOS-regulon protein
MTTLTELENAAQALDRKDQEELFLFLAKQLRTDGCMPEPRVFDVQQIESWVAQDETDMAAFRNHSSIQ